MGRDAHQKEMRHLLDIVLFAMSHVGPAKLSQELFGDDGPPAEGDDDVVEQRRPDNFVLVETFGH